MEIELKEKYGINNLGNPDIDIVECEYCKGKGIIIRGEDGSFDYCKRCDGTGKVIE
jgi:DnaJ-class molecular chaperone